MGTHTISSSTSDARSVLDSVRRIVRALRVSSRAAEKQVGLSGAQLFVLQKLADGGRALSLNELAERTLTHQSSVSVVVQRLVDRKFISVSRSRADARRIELALTAAGRRAASRASGAAQDRIIDALRRMPSHDRRDLARLLDQLVRASQLTDLAPSLFFEEDSKEPHASVSGKELEPRTQVSGKNPGKNLK